MGKQKKKDIQWFLLVTVVLIVVNVVSFNFFKRFDLTEDQRYSISDKTKEIIAGVEENVYVELLFDGSTSAEYQQLFKTVKETLDEFKITSDNKLVYFINPPAKAGADSLVLKQRQLVESMGVKRRFKTFANESATSAKLVYPGAIIRYKDRQLSVNFIKDGKFGAEENFGQSINEVEFELTSTIKSLSAERVKNIAFLGGHGELEVKNVYSIIQELVKYYEIPAVGYQLDKQDLLKDSIDLLIIAQPKTAFSERDKYVLDQYAINGGRILYFLDALELRKSDSINGFVTIPYKLEIDNLLRTYGVRLAEGLIQDYTCEYDVVVTENGKPELKRFPFLPVLSTFGTHGAVKGCNPILGQYTGVLDTLKVVGMNKTPLLFSSQYTKLKAGGLIPFDYMELLLSKDEKFYNQKNLPVAYLCEGELNSLYAHRPKPDSIDTKEFKTKGKDIKVVVVADGDIIRNSIDPRTRKNKALGASIISQKMIYANSSFILNIVNYLLDEKGVVTVKSKEIKPRPLDEFKFDEASERYYWVFINLGLPVLIVLLFAVARYFYRKNKFS